MRLNSFSGSKISTAAIPGTNGVSLGPGQVVFAPTIGGSTVTTTWTAPAGVTSVSVLVVGAGGYNASISAGGTGGGGGGALAYKNNITVVPGTSYNVVAGAPGNPGPGGASSFTAGFGTITAAVVEDKVTPPNKPVPLGII